MTPTPMITRRIDHPSAWKSSDFASMDDYSIDLEAKHIRALDAALVRVRERGLEVEAITRHDFLLPDVQDLIDEVRDQLLDGTGFVMIRGWPVDDYPVEDVGIMYYGFGTHFGKSASQSVMGDRLGYVADHSHEDPYERAYRNKYALALHTDLNDLIGMLNIRQAGAGGQSQYASAIAVHNEMLATRPDLLPPLYEGFYYHRRGEEAPGQPAVTPHKVPIFSTVDGVLSCRYVDSYMPAAAVELGIELPPELLEGIACFEEIAAREDFKLDIVVEPGEMTFINNLITMHGRSAFDTHAAEPGNARLFLRLWLDVEGDRARPRVPELSVYEGDSIAEQDGRTPVFKGAAWEGIHASRFGEAADRAG